MAKSSQAISNSPRPQLRAVDPAGRVPPQPWMNSPQSNALFAALSAQGGKARFVGGCVRDAVIGRQVKDIDIATTVHPDDVRELLAEAGIRTIPTGIDHGTVAALVDGAFFEITTLRRDVETDGRRAKVQYTKDWAADAQRRDFTMNALYCTQEGTLYDPTGGLADLRAGTVRFVGDGHARIREDVLRILRFFRFHAFYGSGRPDKESLQACVELAGLIEGLSAERVAAETLKLLSAPDPTATVELMLTTGVLRHVVPQATNLTRLTGLVAAERMAGSAYLPDPLLRLAALIVDLIFYADKVATRLKLSNAQRSRLVAIGEAPPVTPDMDRTVRRRAFFKLGPTLFHDCAMLGWAEANAAAPNGLSRARVEDWQQLLRDAAHWTPPVFPISGRDALAMGVEQGPRVGRLLEAVQAWWQEQDFAPDRDACLARLRSLAGKG